LSWNTPVTDCGAVIAEITFASTPPIVAVTGSARFFEFDSITSPVMPTGSVCPPPVPNSVTVELRSAGHQEEQENWTELRLQQNHSRTEEPSGKQRTALRKNLTKAAI
jgi:hypothetical protein